MEKQIKKELEEMGILSAEELEGGEGGGVNGGDEVLAELERCQAELKVSDHADLKTNSKARYLKG